MHPILYEVDLFVDEEIAADFEAWLNGHRDEMLSIDGFLDASIYARELLDEDVESGQRRLSVHYRLRDQRALEHYLEHEAPRLRAAGRERFGSRFFARRSLLRSAAPSPAKRELYAELERDLRALLSGETDFLANMANTSALLSERLPGLNWVGFYLLRGRELVLGPFQGRAACVRLALDRGVCGAAATQRRTLVVDDVHAFQGHVACDARSRSELVVPLLAGQRLLGVLDLDSPLLGRFDAADRAGLEAVARALLELSDTEAMP